MTKKNKGKKPEYANKTYRIKRGQMIVGLVLSQEEEAVIGHLVDTKEIFTPVGGMVFDDGVKEYVIVDVNVYSWEDLIEVGGCAGFLKDLENLAKNKVITIEDPLTVIEVMDANFGYFN